MTSPLPNRVLLIAEAANPEWVSVPLVGWSLATALLRRLDGHLVTQVRNQAAIERTPLSKDTYTAIDSERVAKLMWQLGSSLKGGWGKGWTTLTALSAPSYYYFEHLVWKQFGDAIRRHEFDLVHRITPLSPTTPSLLAGKCRAAGVPFVLGPLNGGVPWPQAFDAARRQEKEWLSYIRDGYKLLPGYRGTRKHAAAIIVGSCDTWKQIPTQYHSKCVYIPENAVEPARFPEQRTRTVTRPLRVLFLGRLVPYKGADMLLEAAAPLIRSGDVCLKIMGEGPQMGTLQQMIHQEQLTDQVQLTGWVDHAEIQEHLKEADLFAFPSVREFGGAVALEAMAVGLVPMVIRYGGLGELVNEDTGFLIEMGDRATIVSQLREMLKKVIQQPELIEQKAVAARQRVQASFTWDVKAEQVIQVYEWVLQQRAEKPSWGMPFRDAACAVCHE